MATETPGESSSFFLTRLITKLTAASKIQLAFFLLLLGLFPPLVPFLNAFSSIVQMRKDANPEYPWPEYSDLKLALYVAVVVYLLWGCAKKPLQKAVERRILPKYTGELRQDRAARAAENIFKGTYYLFIVIFGYFVARDAPFLPPHLGGSGSMSAMFEGYPYQAFASFPLVRPYLMVQLGYHLFSFTDHMMSKPKNTFMEMLLHHSTTLLLISLAYFMNYIPVSHQVLFLHDISDLFMDAGRATSDTPFHAFTTVMGIGVVTSWAYTRLYLFPFHLIHYAYFYNSAPEEELYGKHLLAAMLGTLLILHIYWFVLIVKMFFNLAVKKKHVDVEDRFDAKKQD